MPASECIDLTNDICRSFPTTCRSDKRPAEEDPDCIIVEAVQVALRDMAHSRPDCGNHPFVKGSSRNNATFCSECFCFVCDVRASECKHWGNGSRPFHHANACSSSKIWINMKAAAAAAGAAATAAPGAAAAAAAAAGIARPIPAAAAAAAAAAARATARRSAAAALPRWPLLNSRVLHLTPTTNRNIIGRHADGRPAAGTASAAAAAAAAAAPLSADGWSAAVETGIAQSALQRMFDRMATATTAVAQAAMTAGASAAAHSGVVTTHGVSSSSSSGGGFLERILSNITAQPVRRNSRPSSTRQQHSSAQAAAAHRSARHRPDPTGAVRRGVAGTAAGLAALHSRAQMSGRSAAGAAGMVSSNSDQLRNNSAAAQLGGRSAATGGRAQTSGRGAAGAAGMVSGNSEQLRNSSGAAQLGARLAAVRSGDAIVGSSVAGVAGVVSQSAKLFGSFERHKRFSGLQKEC